VVLELGHLVRLAVDEESLFAMGHEGFEEASEFVAVGVGTEAVEHFDLCFTFVFFSEDSDVGLAFDEPSAEGVGGLEADDEDGVFVAADVVFEVMADATGFAHAAGGDDDAGVSAAVDFLAVLDIADVVAVVGAEDVSCLPLELARVRIEEFGMKAKDFGGVDGEGAVDEGGDLGDQPLLLELVQEIDDHLCSADAEGGDDDLAATGDCVVHNFGELSLEVGAGGMEATAVGAFGDEVVARGEGVGISQDRHVAAADVAGEDEADGWFSVGGEVFQFDRRGAEHVTGVVETGLEAARDPKSLTLGNGVEKRDGFDGILFGVEGADWGLALTGTFFVEVLGIFLLDMGGVGEEEGAEVAGGRGCVDVSGEAVPDEEGESSAVVDVCV